MTPQVLVVGALVAAVVTDAAPWVVVLTATCTAFALAYPAVARKVRARRG